MSEHCLGRKGQNWTAPEQTKLAKLISEGKTYAEIATLLGRSESAVSIKASRLKLATRARSRSQVVKNGSRKPRSAAWFLS